jgi:hypothetical protein
LKSGITLTSQVWRKIQNNCHINDLLRSMGRGTKFEDGTNSVAGTLARICTVRWRIAML